MTGPEIRARRWRVLITVELDAPAEWNAAQVINRVNEEIEDGVDLPLGAICASAECVSDVYLVRP